MCDFVWFVFCFVLPPFFSFSFVGGREVQGVLSFIPVKNDACCGVMCDGHFSQVFHSHSFAEQERKIDFHLFLNVLLHSLYIYIWLKCNKV